MGQCEGGMWGPRTLFPALPVPSQPLPAWLTHWILWGLLHCVWRRLKSVDMKASAMPAISRTPQQQLGVGWLVGRQVSPPSTMSFILSLIRSFPSPTSHLWDSVSPKGPVRGRGSPGSAQDHEHCCKMILRLKVKQLLKTKGRKLAWKEWEMLRFWRWS